MPERYHVHVVPTPPRFHRVGKYGNVDWREDCSRCTNCVKLRCLYNVYKSEAAYNRDPDAPVVTLDECKACLSCVQGCTKGLLSVSINPGYLDMGDEYWKPDILLTHVEPGGQWQDPGVGGGLPRQVLRIRVRLHLDRHVRDRPADARWHPWPGIHLHGRRCGPQTDAAALRA